MRVARKNPAAPTHARLTNDALALLFLWGVLTVVFIFAGIVIAAVARASGSHPAFVRVAAALPVFSGAGAAINGARFEWNSAVAGIRRRRSTRGQLRPERRVRWPSRPGDADLLLQVTVAILVAVGSNPK
jgi:hypothetical protein